MTTFPLEVLTAELLPGEKVEWTGRPNPSVIFHDEDWLLIPFSLLCGGFAIFWLLAASGIWNVFWNRPNATFQWFGVIWGTPFVLIGQYMIWGRFLYQRWLKGRTYYALTNRRATIIHRGFGGRSCSSAYFENLALIDKRVRPDGIGAISFGGPVTGDWQWGRGKKPPRPPTFDDVDNADSVFQIAARIHDRASKPDSPTRWGV